MAPPRTCRPRRFSKPTAFNRPLTTPKNVQGGTLGERDEYSLSRLRGRPPALHRCGRSPPNYLRATAPMGRRWAAAGAPATALNTPAGVICGRGQGGRRPHDTTYSRPDAQGGRRGGWLAYGHSLLTVGRRGQWPRARPRPPETPSGTGSAIATAVGTAIPATHVTLSEVVRRPSRRVPSGLEGCCTGR